jgi:hypothetical protein
MTINSLDEFMDAAASNEVTFRLDADKQGVAYMVGYPHGMDSKLREELKAWADANREELSTFLLNMADDIKRGETGTTFITVNHEDDTKH